MKESRFLELLNLYVDQQIDPKGAALLEEEILRNPARRRTYVQYCRMHKACALLFEQSVAGEGADRLSALEEKIEVNLARERSWSPFAIASGFVAIAAAIAVVAYVRSSSPEDPSANFASNMAQSIREEAVDIPVMPAPERVTLPAPEMGDLRVFFVRGGSESASPGAPLAPDLAWMNFRLSPLVANTSQPLLFEPDSSAGRANSRVLSSPNPPEAATETVGFQFQK